MSLYIHIIHIYTKHEVFLPNIYIYGKLICDFLCVNVTFFVVLNRYKPEMHKERKYVHVLNYKLIYIYILYVHIYLKYTTFCEIYIYIYT